MYFPIKALSGAQKGHSPAAQTSPLGSRGLGVTRRWRRQHDAAEVACWYREADSLRSLIMTNFAKDYKMTPWRP
jgi:hypothetical protein